MGHTIIEQFVVGDIGYVPMGAGHYIHNTGSGILRVPLMDISAAPYFARDEIVSPLIPAAPLFSIH